MYRIGSFRIGGLFGRIQPVIAPPLPGLGGQAAGKGDPPAPVQQQAALFHRSDIEEIDREAGPAEEEAGIRQEGRDLFLEGTAYRRAVQALPLVRW